MPETLFDYTWRHSKREQLLLLALTVLTFPILYVSLEAPKQIVNEAIGGESFPTELLGFSFSQLEYLALLCGIFLAAVVASGLAKMQLNLMKGVLAERLLRRFRYDLIFRIHRFPLAHFRRKSQGELISMVTAEAEPLAGVMGNLIAQPLFQAGQMLTILLFLFMQNVWLALAAIALIPVQAYVIPLLQRRINLLNKQRVQHVRRLAETMGESVSGMADVRVNNAAPYRLAIFSDNLGKIFEVRYQIYRIKFFMKFLNNFINQLTPFFFFAIGGYLVIAGDLTLGALVAALAAFKDLSAPWKELLNFYNQFSDMTLRYRTVVEQFEPPNMLPAALVDGRARSIPSLQGPIKLEGVTVGENPAAPVLDQIDLEIPAGAMVGVKANDGVERQALLGVLARTAPLRRGRVTVADHDLSALHQEVIGRRIGVVADQPYLFNGTVGRNLIVALRSKPLSPETWPDHVREQVAEAAAVGNSADPLNVDWLDPQIAGFETDEELRAWWLRIVETMGTDVYLLRRAIGARIYADRHEHLVREAVGLRETIRQRIADAGLSDCVIRFDPDAYHPALALGENLLFAIPGGESRLMDLASEPYFLQTLEELGLTAPLRDVALEMLKTLTATFDEVGTDHPLFQRLELNAELFKTLAETFRDAPEPGHTPAEKEALLLTLPFKLTAETFPEAFKPGLRARIVEIRKERGAALREMVGDQCTPIAPDLYIPGLTLLENLVYGKISGAMATTKEKIIDIAAEVLVAAGLKGAAAITISDVETGIGGAALPAVARERIGFVRAVVKRPDILLLERALGNQSPEVRQRIRDRLRELLPDATLVFFEPEFRNPAAYDLIVEIADGRIAGQSGLVAARAEPGAGDDMEKKMRVVRGVILFENLPASQVRLLAFASDWVKTKAGAYLFRSGDPTDGAYILVKGRAELRWPGAADDVEPVSQVEPGRMIGDLSVIMNTDRTIDLMSSEDSVFLRIRKEELREIIASDVRVATNLLETVSGYLVQSVASRPVRPRENKDGPGGEKAGSGGGAATSDVAKTEADAS